MNRHQKNIAIVIIALLTISIFTLYLLSAKKIISLPTISSTSSPRSTFPSATPTPFVPQFGVKVTISPAAPSAQEAKNSLSPHLPIRINNFQNSTSIVTTINIYSFKYDPSSVVRLEIYGINYNQTSPNLQNPNAQAFKDSFLHAISIIKSYGVDPRSLQFIYGSRQYIQQAAQNWVDTLHLLD